jgi:hypothetical protein
MCTCCEFRLLLYDGPHCLPSAISTPMDFAVACEASQRLRCLGRLNAIVGNNRQLDRLFGQSTAEGQLYTLATRALGTVAIVVRPWPAAPPRVAATPSNPPATWWARLQAAFAWLMGVT